MAGMSSKKRGYFGSKVRKVVWMVSISDHWKAWIRPVSYIGVKNLRHFKPNTAKVFWVFVINTDASINTKV
jgi:hypothetical protein